MKSDNQLAIRLSIHRGKDPFTGDGIKNLAKRQIFRKKNNGFLLTLTIK